MACLDWTSRQAINGKLSVHFILPFRLLQVTVIVAFQQELHQMMGIYTSCTAAALLDAPLKCPAQMWHVAVMCQHTVGSGLGSQADALQEWRRRRGLWQASVCVS